MHRTNLVLASALTAAVAAILPATATPAARAAAGCSGALPVVAHHAGGRVLHPQPSTDIVACGTTTGLPGAESHIVVRRDGTVIYTPAVMPQGFLGTGTAPIDENNNTQSNASPAGLAVTSDDGAHWHVVKPSGVTWNPTDHSEYVDPRTGRTFYEDYGPIPEAPSLGPQQEGPAHINWTDDLRHWHHTVISGLTLPENPRFTSAVAPRGGAQPRGYPDVLYFCANTNVGFVAPVIAGRLCFRSLDGGNSWQQGALLFTGAAPQHPECGASGENYSAIDGYYPQPTRDGRLYVMVACGGKTYLARSDDEAASFPIMHAQGHPVTLPVPASGISIGGTPELRITSAGIFVLVYQQGSHLLMRLSHTRGVTWSKTYDLTAPGVVGIHQWALAQSGRNDLAIAYLGQRRGQSTWDGYVTATHDLSAALRPGPGPLLWSGRVNPSSRPLLYGSSVQGSGYLAGPGGTSLPFPPPFNNQSTGNDFIGAAIGPDGTPWGSFTQDCGPAPSAAGCQRQHDQTRGYVGHLRFG
ncbi:MAG TPA: sialidase family protein [Mycobacteriales bacterium]|nr:sialidase family protein [Mycobacteriales bacterium]